MTTAMPMMDLMTKPKYSRTKALRGISVPGDELADKNIPLYNSLHAKMKEAAGRQDIPVYEAYADASRMYLQHAGFNIPGLGELSPDEKTFTEEALKVYRLRKTNRVFESTVEAIKAMVRVVLSTRT